MVKRVPQVRAAEARLPAGRPYKISGFCILPAKLAKCRNHEFLGRQP